MAEGAGLLNQYTGNRIEGSNPSPSASKSLNSRNLRAGFELPVWFASFRGSLPRPGVRPTVIATWLLRMDVAPEG